MASRASQSFSSEALTVFPSDILCVFLSKTTSCCLRPISINWPFSSYLMDEPEFISFHVFLSTVCSLSSKHTVPSFLPWVVDSAFTHAVCISTQKESILPTAQIRSFWNMISYLASVVFITVCVYILSDQLVSFFFTRLSLPFISTWIVNKYLRGLVCFWEAPLWKKPIQLFSFLSLALFP